MKSHLSIAYIAAGALVVLIGFTSAQYSSYSSQPTANAGSATLSQQNGNNNYGGSAYNQAKDFRAAENGIQRSRGSYGGAALTSSNGQRSYNGEITGFNGMGAAAADIYGNDNGAAQQQGTSKQAASNGQAASNAGYSSSSSGQYSEDLSQPSANDPDGDSIIGEAGRDYPTLVQPIATGFQCSSQQLPGLYADVDAQCQMFHICQKDGRQDSFVCPIGSIFNQKYFVCDWWYNVNCADAPSFYHLNAELYKEPERSAAVSAYYGANGGSSQPFSGQSAQPTNGNNGYQNGASSVRTSANGYRNGASSGRVSSNDYQNGIASGRQNVMANGFQNGGSYTRLSSNGAESTRLSSNGYQNGAVSSRFSSNGYQNRVATGRANENGHNGDYSRPDASSSAAIGY